MSLVQEVIIDTEAIVQEITENIFRLQRPIAHRGWKAIGLSHGQVGMMYMLFYHQDCSVKQIASFLDVTQSAVTQIIEPLLRNGLVERRVDPQDRRRARLGLTTKGQSLLKKFRRVKTEGLRAALDKLSKSELQQLLQLTRKMSSGARTSSNAKDREDK